MSKSLIVKMVTLSAITLMSVSSLSVLAEDVSIIPVDTTTQPVDTTVPTTPPVDTTVPTTPPVDTTVPTTPPVDTAVPTTPPVDTTVPTTPPVDTTDPTTPPVDTTDPTTPSTGGDTTTPTEPSTGGDTTTPTTPTTPSTGTTTPTENNPVITDSGKEIISTENGKVVIKDNATGAISKVAPEEIGAKANADGSITLKDSKGKMTTLPSTNEDSKNSAILSLVGISTIFGLIFKKRFN